MNRIHHLVWNRALGVMQVVSELANGTAGGGARTTVRRRLRRSPLALACASVLGISSVLAAMPASAANVVIPTTATPSDLTVDTSGPGNISQTGPVTVGGTTSLTAGGTITLTNASNDFTGAVSATGSNIDLTNSNALVLGTFNIAGNTALTAGGTITQTGALSTSSLSGSAVGDVALSNAGNAIVTLGSFSAANFSLNNAQALTVNGPLTTTGGTGTISLTTTSGALTVNTALAGSAVSLAGATGIMLNNNVSTGGAQTYHSAVTLGADTTLASSGSGAISFDSTVNGAYALTVNTSGATSFGGAVGGTTALTSLTTNIGGSTVLGGNVTTSGAQAYNDAVTLGGDVTLATTNNNVSFGNTVDNATTTARNLTVNAGSGAVTFGGAIGGNATNGALGALSVNSTGTTSFNAAVQAASLTTNVGGSTVLGGNVTTAGTQTYGDAMTLGANATLTGTTVSLAAVTGAGNNLTVTGNAVLAGPVSGVNALQVSGTTNLNTASVSTSGSQTYSDAVTLGADTVLANSGSGNIGFDSTVNGAYALTVNAGGATSFGGAVGGTTALTSLTTDAGGSTMLGGNVATSGAQAYNNLVALGADVTLATVNGAVSFGSTVDNATATKRALTVNAGTGAVTFTGALGNGANGALASLVTHSGTFNANALNIGSGELAVTTTAGGITQGGAFTVAGASSFNAGSGAITLTNSGNDFTGAVSLSNSGANDVAVSDAGALVLGASTIGSGALTLTATGISQTGAIVQAAGGGAVTLDAGVGDLTLTNAGNDFTGPVTASGQAVRITDATALDVVGLTSAPNKDVSLVAGGQLTLAPTIIAIDTGSGNLTLSSGTSLTTLGDLSGNNVSLTGASGLTLNSFISASGTLTLASSTGGISQTAGGIAVGSTSSISGGTGAVSLASAGNDFVGTVTASGSSILLTDMNALTADLTTIGDAVLTAGGNLAVSGSSNNLTTNAAATSFDATMVGGNLSTTAAGAINQTGALSVTGSSSLAAGANAITLTNAGNDFTGAVSLTGGATQITDSNALTLDTLGTRALTAISTGALNLGSGNIDGNLVATSNNGTISQSGALTVSGSSTLNAGSGAITLTNSSNDFTGAVGLSNSGANNVSVRDTNGLIMGNINVGAGTLSVQAVGITQAAGTAIVQSAAAGAASFNSGGGAITLANSGNDFTGAVSLTGGATQITDSNVLTLGTLGTGALTAVSTGALNLGSGNIGGNLVTTSNNGAISQTGALQVAGSSMLNAGSGTITLDNANNDFTGAVDATGTGITLYDGGNLTLSSLSNGANGAVDLQAAGTLSLPTTAIATGTSNLHLSSGAALTTPGDLSGANVSLSGGAGVTLANNVNTGGTLTLASSSGAISNAAGMLTAGTLTGHSTGATTLTGPNQIGSLDAFTANGFSLSNAQALTVIGAVSGGTGATTLTTTGAGSDLDVTATGSINGGAVSLAAGRGMNLASNVSGATVDLSASGTMLLTGTIASTGGTTVQAGKLEVGDATHPGASVTGNVVVNSGATLGGHGTIGGDVALASGAHLAPGGSIGTLTIGGNAAFAQGSVLDYEFGAPGANFQTAGSGDSVKVGGSLSLNGAVLNVTDAGGFGPGLYNLFTYGGTLTETNGGIALGTTPAGDTLLVQNLTADKQINLLNTTGMTLNLWNGNGLASATQMGGGNGTWTTTSPNWTDATGSVSAAMQPQPGFAIVGGTTAGTVTVDNSTGAVSATGMQFASNGYILTGGTLNLIGSGAAPIIRVGDGSSAGAGYIATVNNVIAGTSGLTKSDLGTLVLNGANIYSGGTTINGGTLEVANNSALGSDGVTVDNTGNQGATLKVDSGITLANTIAINNGGTLDNAGTISHTGATEVGVNATGGMATVTNHDGGNIAGGVIGLWLHTGGTVVNTGNTSRIDGAGYALVTDGSPDSVVTNENGASIHGGTQDSVLMIQGGTLINQSGASISGDSVAMRMSQNGTIINQSGASISGTGTSSYGVILHQGGTITNQGGATIQGGDSAIALAGASTITNAAGSSIIGGNTSVSVFGSGAVSLTNAGVLSGSIYLNSGDANAVTLISGSTLTGSLYIGSNTGSQLTLDGNGTQLYSTAVTGTTSFAGTLTKQGAGSWIVDSDLAPTTTLISAGTLQIGNDGTSGSLGGDITDNAALVSNLSGAGTLAGAISGSGSLTQDGSGVLTLTGANSYTGGTTISAGTLQGNTTSLQGNITDNAMLAFNQANAGTFAGAVSGSGALNKLGNGTLTLTGTNTYAGGTTISAGTLQLGNGGTAGSISGNVIDNGTLAFDRSDAVTFAGTVTGSGRLVQNGRGTLILTGANSYTGGTTISAGTLQGDTTSLQGNIADNATLVFNQATAGIYAGAISGAGVLSKTGAGTLTFNGSSPFSGATTVTSGKLVVGDDSHAGANLGGMVTVASGATLGGIGTIGGLNLAGTVTPGNSIGTLRVTGDATFQQGSSYQIEAAPNGSSDQIAAAGKVTILGGSAVVLAQAGNWAPRTDYTIITGAQGVSGQFASASSSLLFLDPVLSYTANAVNLSLQRNDTSFASVAQTPNQLAVATTTNGLGFVSPMYSALTTLDAPASRHAFDQLSGVIHASTSTALVDDSRYVREAINRHLLGLNGGTEGTTAQGVSVWANVWGHGGHHDDNGNAASLQANGSGLLVGADLSLDSNSRLGAVVGHGQNSIRENSLGSSAHVLGDHVGLYGSSSFGAFVLRGGMAYARQDVHSNRSVAFGTYNDWLSSKHHAQTAQAYVEGGYQFNMSPGQQLEPFVNVARVRVHSDALQEGGGNAALAVAGNSASVNTATLGLRDTLTLDAAGGIRAHASLGYQRAWGDLAPVTTMRFVTGGNSFAVAGMPVARHALTTDLGIDFKLARNVNVDASYLGQFASGVQDQGARMSLTVTF